MAEKEQHEEREPLDDEELEEQNGEPLPDREVLSTIDFNPGPMVDVPPSVTLPVEPDT
jgi:hypothetical protein